MRADTSEANAQPLRGCVTAGQAWKLLCETGPFGGISKAEFAQLLKGLGEREVLVQDASGLLLYGQLGEKLANHYTFYAAFTTEEEFRLVTEGKTLGAVPISSPLEPDSHVIFAGRRWRVRHVDLPAKVIEVVPDKGGKPPGFTGGGGKVHDRVREEMRKVLLAGDAVPFLDQHAAALLSEARENFRRIGLDTQSVFPAGGGVRLFPWKGDWVMDTLALAFERRGYKAENEGLCLKLREADRDSVSDILFDLSEGAFPTETELAGEILNKVQEKWDWLLTDGLLNRNYASHNLDIPGAKRYFSELVSQGTFKAYK